LELEFVKLEFQPKLDLLLDSSDLDYKKNNQQQQRGTRVPF